MLSFIRYSLLNCLLPPLFLFSIGLQAQQGKFFDIRDGQIIGPDNRPFLMKGTNLGNWLVPEGYMFRFERTSSPRLIQDLVSELVGPSEAKLFWKRFLDEYITREDIRFLKASGMNSIRIPFHYKLFTNDEYLGGSGEKRGFELMDRVIGWCREEKLYVILDMHCAPGGQTGDNIDDSRGYPFLFEDSASQRLTVETWLKIARHYASEKMIIGYDLLNEPIAHYFDSTRLNHLLEPLYKKLAAAIRTVDKDHLLFIGGAQWNSNFRIFGPPFDRKSVYTFHKYWTPATTDVIREYIDYGKQYGVPLYCGETGENTDEWIHQFRTVLDQQQIGWHFWPYKKLESRSCVLTILLPAGYEKIIAYANADRYSYDQIRKARQELTSEACSRILKEYLNQVRFDKCIPNSSYLDALGFQVPK
jgi:aryl-phospho-beta-D-glucosidase BglC (GH1 family)